MAKQQWLEQLLSSSNYSDCTISCGKDDHKVHKAVVCSQSSFFEKTFSIEMKEKETGKVSLEEDCPQAVKSMIEFMYINDYEPPTSPEPNEQGDNSTADELQRQAASSMTPKRARKAHKGGQPVQFDQHAVVAQDKGFHLVHHARVYALGDKYHVSGLQSLAASKFQAACSFSWNSNMFTTVAFEAYMTTLEEDRGLRDIVVNTILEYRQLIHKPELQTVMQSTKLGFDLFIAMHRNNRNGSYY